MQPSAVHGTASPQSPVLCRASGFMTGTAQSRKVVKVEIVDRIVQTAQNSINPTISFFGCTAATSSMKQQAPKTLPQKAETIENTRKTADILIGAACQNKTPMGVFFSFGEPRSAGLRMGTWILCCIFSLIQICDKQTSRYSCPLNG